MSWPLVLLITALYIALMLLVAYWLGGLLREAGRAYPELEPVRCTCRRYGFPSPLCKIHGSQAA